MRKLFTLFLLCVLGFSMSQVRAGKPTLQQMQKMVAEGKAFKETNPHVKFRPRANDRTLQHVMTSGQARVQSQVEKLSREVRAAAPKGGNLYGYLSFTIDPEGVPGMYEFTEQGTYELFWPDPLWDNYQTANDGWLKDNKVCGYILDMFMGYFWGYFYFEIDFQSGDLLKLEEFPIEELTAMFYIANLNTVTDEIYGYVTTPDGICWAKAPASNPGQAIVLRPADDDYCYSLCFNPADNTFYGVNIKQQFVKVAENGAQTVISEVPQTSTDVFGDFFTGLIWNPKANAFYWNANMDLEAYNGSYMSRLYTISADGVFTRIANFNQEEEFTYFITDDEVPSPTVPMKPAVVGHDFPKGSLTGTVTFAIPTTFNDGSPLPAEVAYQTYLDDDLYSEGTVATGTEKSVTFTDVPAGMHSIGMSISVDGQQSTKSFTRFFVGVDEPAAPSRVVLTKTGISWQPVTAGIHNGYIDTEALTYNVYLNGEYLGNTAETSYENILPDDAPMEAYYAAVEAVVGDQKSEQTTSNKVIAGDAYAIPMNLQPTYDQFEVMTVVDNNRDGSSWRFEDGALFCSFTIFEEQPMDDYLFLPPVKVTDPEKYYTFSLEAGLRHPASPEEYLEVYYATAPRVDAICETVIPRFKPTAVADFYGQGEFSEFSGLLKVPEAGNYYIAIRCDSPGGNTGVVVRNLSLIDDNIVATSPAPATDLKTVAAAQGDLRANVSFNMPLKTMLGDDLPADAELTATVYAQGNEDKAVELSGTPGKHLSVNIPTFQGDNVINVQVHYQGANSSIATVNVYTGVSVPATPENFFVIGAPDMMSARLTWDAVTEPDVPGGYVNPETVYYNLLQLNTRWNRWEYYLEGIKGTSYDLILTPEDPQNQYVFGIEAANEAGANGYINYNAAFLGAPYKLPFEEEITPYGFTTQPWFIYDEMDGQQYDADYGRFLLSEISEDYPTSDDVVLVGMSENSNGRGLLGLPRFSTQGFEGVNVTLTMLKGDNTTFDIIFGTFYGNDGLIEVGTIEGNTADQALQDITISLPKSLMDKDWVQLYIESNFEGTNDMFVMSAVKITSTSGVTILDTAATAIYGDKGAVVLNGLAGCNYVISDLDGKILSRGVVEGDAATVAMPAGLYVVSAGDKTAKVLIR